MGENHRHVIGLGAMESLPLEYWFGQCFAGYIAETSLVRYNQHTTLC